MIIKHWHRHQYRFNMDKYVFDVFWFRVLMLLVSRRFQHIFVVISQRSVYLNGFAG